MSSSVSSTPSLPYTSFQCRLLMSTRRRQRAIVSGSCCWRSTTRAGARSANSGSASSSGARLLVEVVEVGDRQGLARVGVELDEVLDQHAERAGPSHRCGSRARPRGRAARACARWRHRSPWCAGGRCASPWRRWAPSSRRRRARASRAGDAEALVGGDAGERRAEEGVVDREVEEAGAGDLDRGHAGEVGGGEHVGGDVARVAPDRLGEGSAPLAWASARSDGRTTGSTAATAASSSPPARATAANPGARRSARRSEQVGHGRPIVAPRRTDAAGRNRPPGTLLRNVRYRSGTQRSADTRRR